VTRESRVRQDLWDRKAHKVHRVYRERLDHRVSRVSRVFKESKERSDLLVIPARRESRALRVRQV
jgi:hypothetical protein